MKKLIIILLTFIAINVNSQTTLFNKSLNNVTYSQINDTLYIDIGVVELLPNYSYIDKINLDIKKYEKNVAIGYGFLMSGMFCTIIGKYKYDGNTPIGNVNSWRNIKDYGWVVSGIGIGIVILNDIKIFSLKNDKNTYNILINANNITLKF